MCATDDLDPLSFHKACFLLLVTSSAVAARQEGCECAAAASKGGHWLMFSAYPVRNNLQDVKSSPSLCQWLHCRSMTPSLLRPGTRTVSCSTVAFQHPWRLTQTQRAAHRQQQQQQAGERASSHRSSSNLRQQLYLSECRFRGSFGRAAVLAAAGNHSRQLLQQQVPAALMKAVNLL